MRYLATDVGGTFTDMVMVDGVTGRHYVDKVPSGARGSATHIAVGIRQILEQAGLDAEDIDLFVHGFTVSTNALLMGAGQFGNLNDPVHISDVTLSLRSDVARLSLLLVMRSVSRAAGRFWVSAARHSFSASARRNH